MSRPIAVWIPLGSFIDITEAGTSGVCSGGTINGALAPTVANRDGIFRNAISGRFQEAVDQIPGPEEFSILGNGNHRGMLVNVCMAGRINETPFRVWFDPDLAGPLPAFPKDHPTSWAMDDHWVDTMFDIGCSGLALWPDSNGGNILLVLENSVQVSAYKGPGWGCSLAARAIWDPTIKWIDKEPLTPSDPSDDDDRPVYVNGTRRDRYSLVQWPYGTNDAPDWTPDALGEMSYRSTSKPCWILSNITPPFPELNAADEPLGFTGSDTVNAFNMGFDVYMLRGQGLFWFTPKNGEHYDHHYYSYWNDLMPQEVDASANFFMGKPQFADPNKAGINAGSAGDWASSFDRSVNWHHFFGSWYNNQEMTNFSANFPYLNAETEFAYPNRLMPGLGYDGNSVNTVHYTQQWNTCNPYVAPHVGLDAEFRLPYLEFNRPAKLDILPPGTVLESATAEIFVTGTARVEFDVHHYLEKGPNRFFFARHPTEGGTTPQGNVGDFVGWKVLQKSTEGAGTGDGREQYVRVHQAISEWTSTGIKYKLNNTHVKHDDYESIVTTEGGTAPTTSTTDPYTDPPNWIPKAVPWFPDGDSRLSNGPEPVTALTGLRVKLALIGMQPQKEILGGTPSDLTVERTIKEMERNHLWHSPNFDFGPEDWVMEHTNPPATYTEDDPFDNESYHNPDKAFNTYTYYAANESYLTQMRNHADVSDTVGDLEDFRYRWLESCDPRVDSGNGRDQVIFPGQWETANIDSLMQAILDDAPKTATNEWGETYNFRHTRYRLMLCAPGNIHFQAQTSDGHYRNIGPLFTTMLPKHIGFPAKQTDDWYLDNPQDPPDATSESWQINYRDLIYQKFSTFQIRNIVANLRTPGGRRVKITITTPWDA